MTMKTKLILLGALVIIPVSCNRSTESKIEHAAHERLEADAAEARAAKAAAQDAKRQIQAENARAAREEAIVQKAMEDAAREARRKIESGH